MKRSKPLRRTGFKPRPFTIVVEPDYGRELYEALRAPAPEVEGPHFTTIRGEVGVIDCGIRIINDMAAQLRVRPLHRGTYGRVRAPAVPIPKRPPIRSRKLLDNVGLLRTCAFCMRQRPVVACHSNWQIHGKAGAMKADDNRIAAGCAECHHELDQGDDWGTTEKQRRWWTAHVLTVRWMLLEFLWVEGVPIPDTRSYPF